MEKISRKKARKPAQLLEGKYSQQELNERKQREKDFAELMTKDNLNNVPESLNKYGAKHYLILKEQLKNIPLFTDLDKSAMTQLAMFLGVLEESNLDIKNNGLIIPTTYGPKPNPHLKIIKEYSTLYLNYAKSLSLTPEMRQHMQKLTEENVSQFASEENVQFLNKVLEKKFNNG
ncbi:P27 family phage terminase small subunit [Priestia megaterium]|uniref:P27 family phage terminase small subunit n=1 Tax=Priestia megaterium TaxID=1404 RepID=UPI0027959BC7|nr:P27 family phage terminase small subunit [Priestia megaterium]